MKDKFFSIYFIRHAKIKGIPAIYGSTDVDIYPIDTKLIEKIITHNKIDNSFEIISSPLTRCIKTAQPFKEILKKDISINNNLKEIHFGILDGLPFSKYTEKQKKVLDQLYKRPAYTYIKEAEKLSSFKKRIEFEYKKLFNLNQNLIVITHCGVIKTILANLMGCPIKSNKLWINFDLNYLSGIKVEGVYYSDLKLTDYKVTLLPSFGEKSLNFL